MKRKIYPSDGAARFYASAAGRPYRPSSGTEGEIFEAAWCDGCSIRGICRIPGKAMACDVRDAAYPTAWVYGDDGQPRCTAFRDKSQPRPRPLPIRPGPHEMDDLFVGRIN
ncbi:hypothetical protein MKK88_28495 [Methylobacterium sp. E-005]|uniref:hypothetical protein n=1 Tax=Methylobacterium sp. E-005 TaxID=2836549 RepID=UPI001FB961E3|nr:hypothetical protein [Methylobacterium sp. E-005]MCJ2089898.1 hypothetical protein [Methylobacterium sp. E-005]